MKRRRKWLIGVAVALGVAGFLYAGRAPLLRMAGGWLVIEDPLPPADAIVVVAGGTPFHEAAAAALFKQGLAPRVILSRAAMSEGHVALMELGIRPLDSQAEAREALLRYGVPPAVILAIREFARITEAELAIVHRVARANGYRRLIFVASPEHARRVKMIWKREAGNSIEGLVHPAEGEEFSPENWWHSRRMAERVLHEYLGIAAITLGISHLMN